MLAWVAALLVQGTAAQGQVETPLTRNSAPRLATAELARRLLPPDLAARIVAHEEDNLIGLVDVPLWGIRFFARPRPLPGGRCRRGGYYVSLAPAAGGSGAPGAWRDLPLTVRQVTETVQIALAPNCVIRAGGSFAWVQRPSQLEGAMAALRWVSEVSHLARRTLLPPGFATCRSEVNPEVCARGGQAVLATLPLEATWIIEPMLHHAPAGWRLAVMPPGPGQPYWDVRVDSTAPDAPRLVMTWGPPSPF